MKVALIIEQDLVIQAQMKAALTEVDPQIEPLFFEGLRPLSEWMKAQLGIGEDPANPKSQKQPADRIALVVGRTELFGRFPVRLLKKAKVFLQRKGFVDEGVPLEFLLTVNPSPKFKIERHRDAVIFNLIIIPVDPLMLRQVLIMALQSDKAPAPGAVFRQKIKGPIEIIKDVFLEAIGDAGFVTRSERAIDTGLIAKYYLPVLDGQLPNFIYARCFQSKPHPQFPGAFLCSFSYYAIRTAPLTAIRKHLKGRHKSMFYRPEWQDSQLTGEKATPINIVIVDRNDDRFTELKNFFERTLKSARVFQIQTYLDLLCKVDPKTAGFEINDLQLSSRRFVLQAKTSQVMSIYPDLTAAFIGYKAPDIIKKERFFDNAVLQEDQVQMMSFLTRKLETGSKEVIRFQSKKGRLHLVEFTFTEATPVSTTYDVRELPLYEIEEFFRTVRPLEADVIYLHSSELGEGFKERIPALASAIERQKLQIPIFVLREVQKEPLPLEWLIPQLTDLFELPGDRMQMFLRLIQVIPQKLTPEDRLNYQMARIQSLAKVAKEAEFTELSESTVVIPYYRSMQVGDHRSFHFPKMDSKNVLEFWARCAFVEPVGKGGDAICYFHFFGLSDAYLKELRNNIRESFVLLKEKENAGQ